MKFRSFMVGFAILLILVVGLWAVAERPTSVAVPVRTDPVAAPVVTAVAASADAFSAAPVVPVASSSSPGAADVQRSVTSPVPAPARPAAPAIPLVRAPAVAGRLLIPVFGVRSPDLVDTYQQARGEGRRHDAIDIRAPRGTPVLAAADGTVLKLFLSVRGGIALYQLATDGHTVYYYAHLDRYAEGMADRKSLREGDIIGYVGDTGNAGAGNYHLHFEVLTTPDPKRYWGGIPQNPYPLLH